MSRSADPLVPDQLFAQAHAALASGEMHAAAAAARAALEHRPQWAEARVILANASLQAGDLDTAIEALHALCQQLGQPPALRSALATALNNRGSRRRAAHREDEALEDFDAALAWRFDHPQAGFNRGLSLLALDRRDEAREALAQHLRHSPEDIEARLQHVLLEPAPDLDALDALLASPAADALPAELQLRGWIASRQPQRGLALLDHADCRRHGWALGERLRLDNRAELAREAYARAAEGKHPPLRAALAAALAEDPMADSSAALRGSLKRQQSALNTLAERWASSTQAAEPALDSLAYSPFFLAYQGEDRLPLQQQLGRLVLSAAQAFAPQWSEPPRCAHPRRVLLVGSVFRNCTAGAYFGGWIRWLQEAGFDTVVYQLGPRRDADTERFAAVASRLEFIPEHTPLETIAERLRGESAALLLYPELGMDSRVCALAALRLAARQAMAWGHPASPGYVSLDAYFSCAEMEPADAAEHYAEPLLLLPGLGVDYTRPPAPAAASRAELGLPEDAVLLLAPQSLFKLHPENDRVYADLLQQNRDARLLLFADQPSNKARLIERLRQHAIDPTRLLWLPFGTRERYLQINAACDLMIDSLQFSGGNASLDALQVGLPVLTCPGRLMRGRQTAAMLGRLGLSDALSVSEPAALAARATELLRAAALPDLRRTLQTGLPELFEADRARRAFIEHIETLCAQGPHA